MTYEFTEIAKQLSASLIKGAEDNLVEAQNLLESVKVLVEEINKHVEQHVKLLDDASARTKAYGEKVLTAHKEYINGGRERTIKEIVNDHRE